MTELAHRAPRGAATRRGVVRGFDADRGLGEIESDRGETLLFHCIEIADGSRSIEVGADVEFAVIAKLGRFEAAAVRRR